MQGVPRPAPRGGSHAGPVPALHHPHQPAHPHLPVRDPGGGEGHAVHPVDVGPADVPQAQRDTLPVPHHHAE